MYDKDNKITAAEDVADTVVIWVILALLVTMVFW